MGSRAGEYPQAGAAGGGSGDRAARRRGAGDRRQRGPQGWQQDGGWGRQWLGRYGKTDNGVVTVTTLWADERLYYPVHAVPYTPARHFAKGKNDPAFRTKLQIGASLAVQARAAGFTFRAVAANSAYGDQDGFRGELADAGLPYVMALKPRRGTWAYGADAHTPVDAARALAWNGAADPGDWRPVTRTSATGMLRPGMPPTRNWAGGGQTAPGAWWQPPPARPPCRPRPPGTSSPTCPAPAARARPAARTRLRAWPRSCGSTGSGTGSSKAINRSKTSSAGPTSRSAPTPPSAATRPWSTARSASAGTPGSTTTPRRTSLEHRDKTPQRGGHAPPHCRHLLATGITRDTRLASPLDHAAALVAGVVEQAPATTASPHDSRGTTDESRRLIRRPPADDRRQHADVRDPLRLHIHRIAVQDREIGELARLQRPDLLLPVHGECGFRRIEGERVPQVLPGGSALSG